MNQPAQPNQNSGAKASNQQHGGDSLVDQAKQWLGDTNELIDQLPQPVKNAGTKVASGYNQLSTSQKILGVSLIAAGVAYLLAGGSAKRSAQPAPDAQTDTLHELLLFVNDRIEGYQRAVEESQDAELRGYYKQLVSQSQRFANELNAYLRQQGGGRETGTTAKGKLYRAWMDAKAAVTGSDEKAILGSNVYGEEWAIKAYKEALGDQTLRGVIRQEVERQYEQSQKTYDKLKKLEAKA